MPSLYIIACPNGAGKTTFVRDFLKLDLAFLDFLNADEIARGLSPFNPAREQLEGGRLVLTRFRQSATRARASRNLMRRSPAQNRQIPSMRRRQMEDRICRICRMNRIAVSEGSTSNELHHPSNWRVRNRIAKSCNPQNPVNPVPTP